MSKLYKMTALCLIGVFLWGCDTKGLYDFLINPTQAVTLESGVAIYEHGQRRIVYLEASPGKASTSLIYAHTTQETVEWIKPGPFQSNPTELYIMSLPVDKRDKDAREVLVRINPETRKTTRYDTGAPFDNLFFDDQGKYAILFHGAGQSVGEGFYNPNEVALIDLAQDPGTNNPHRFTVHMGSRRIAGVKFLPEISVGGQKTNLIVFLAEGAVKIVDLSNPTEVFTLVPLVAKDDPRYVVPKKLIVRDQDENRAAMIFVLAEGSQDVYGISLTREEGGTRLAATLNQFEAGRLPTDMVIAEDGDTPLLVVVSPANSYGNTGLNIIKIDTSETVSIQVEDTVSNAYLHQDGAETEIVLYGNNTNGVHFLSVANLATQKGRNLDDLLIPETVWRAMLLDDKRLLIVSGERADIVILDLTTRKSTRFASPREMDWDGAVAFNDRLYFLRSGAKEVDIVDLQNEQPISLLLDDRGASLHLLKGTGTGVVLHDTPSGRATIFDLADPGRAGSLVFDGIWFDDFLNETEAK